MCIICVSKVGIKQPNKKELKTMWDNNHDGAGYMWWDKVKKIVHIRKGFMTFKDLYSDIQKRQFSANDLVVYHFRISTQAKTQAMTHPFALTSRLETTKALSLACNVGVAHNGIISLTTDYKQKEYSDTALFITNYMTKIVRDFDDLDNEECKTIIDKLIGFSRLAIIDKRGKATLIGTGWVTEKNGLIYSNESYKERKIVYKAPKKWAFDWDDEMDYEGAYNYQKYLIDNKKEEKNDDKITKPLVKLDEIDWRY